MHGNAVRCDVIFSVHLCHGLHQALTPDRNAAPRHFGLEKLHLQCRAGRPVSSSLGNGRMYIPSCIWHEIICRHACQVDQCLRRGLIAARDKEYARTSSSAYQSAALAELPIKEVDPLVIIATPWQRVLQVFKCNWIFVCAVVQLLDAPCLW